MSRVTSEMAFKIAGAMAFQDAAKKAMPVLIGPNRSDGDRDSLVGAPLRPVPRSNDSAVAPPEPDDGLVT